MVCFFNKFATAQTFDCCTNCWKNAKIHISQNEYNVNQKKLVLILNLKLVRQQISGIVQEYGRVTVRLKNSLVLGDNKNNYLRIDSVKVINSEQSNYIIIFKGELYFNNEWHILFVNKKTGKLRLYFYDWKDEIYTLNFIRNKRYEGVISRSVFRAGPGVWDDEFTCILFDRISQKLFFKQIQVASGVTHIDKICTDRIRVINKEKRIYIYKENKINKTKNLVIKL